MPSNLAIYYRTPYGMRCTGMYSKAHHRTLNRHGQRLAYIFSKREEFEMSDIVAIYYVPAENFRALQDRMLVYYGVRRR